MARLPSERFLVQWIDGHVLVSENGTERTVARFPAHDGPAATTAQRVIYEEPGMSDEDKALAHFWSGYYHACASGGKS